jgi:hypothetical protein
MTHYGRCLKFPSYRAGSALYDTNIFRELLITRVDRETFVKVIKVMKLQGKSRSYGEGKDASYFYFKTGI